jgi:hypothetical protein
MAQKDTWPKLAQMPGPAKALFTAIIFTMAIAMVGALGQIIVHDIIPTFYGEVEHKEHAKTSAKHSEQTSVERGDLFGVEPKKEDQAKPFYQSEQFVWTLKWTHIHLLTDIASMWLKAYISPAFFWLHIPGGGLFATVFVIVSCRALYEMWGSRSGN